MFKLISINKIVHIWMYKQYLWSLYGFSKGHWSRCRNRQTKLADMIYIYVVFVINFLFADISYRKQCIIFRLNSKLYWWCLGIIKKVLCSFLNLSWKIVFILLIKAFPSCDPVWPVHRQEFQLPLTLKEAWYCLLLYWDWPVSPSYRLKSLGRLYLMWIFSFAPIKNT